MEFIYKTKGTCSQIIKFNLDGDIISNVVFEGGCNGNLKAISALIDGCSVEFIEKKCKGITCGRRETSCADQLAQAVKKAFTDGRL